MILFFADVHMGHRLYSRLTSENISTAEQDTRFALNRIYERAQKDDIDCIVCGGDFFHISKPTSESIRWTIDWLHRIDSLSKPFFIIPGNHDVSTYFHSMEFIKGLKLSPAITLVDKDPILINWNKYKVWVVPFLNAKSAKNKYAETLTITSDTLNNINPTEYNIIIAHIQEVTSKIGAESAFFAKSAEIIDLDNFKAYNNTIVIAGHMHMHQMYEKASGIKVVYPGSLTYMEKTDCNQNKGYITIAENGEVTFEPIVGIRLFKQYLLPKGKDIKDFFSTIRLTNNEVVFILAQRDMSINEAAIVDILTARGCTLGKVSYITADEEERANYIIQPRKNPFLILEEALENRFKNDSEYVDWRDTILPIGKEYLNNAIKHN